MNNSSVQQDYLTTLDNIELGDLTIDLGNTQDYISSNDTITLDTSTVTLNGGIGNVVIGGGGNYAYTTSTGGYMAQTIDTITISNIDSLNWGDTTEWVNGFPAWDRVQEMCKAYPGLKIAFDRLKVVYDLVKDDFDAPPEKRIKP